MSLQTVKEMLVTQNYVKENITKLRCPTFVALGNQDATVDVDDCTQYFRFENLKLKFI